MILVTVGTQLPFDRFIRIVDEAAPSLGRTVFAQVGRGSYQPRNMEYAALIDPLKFDELIARTELIVSHAGIGTVVMAQKFRKPVILFPRRAALGEHRNDHQMATVAALEGRSGMYVARVAEELVALMKRPLDPPLTENEHPARDRLQRAIRDFIENDR
ncbi:MULTISPECIES: glycosyltransferase [Sphingomonas]|jgi:UDP-N-acetylglucosamine transferase subunit ALG13|uniref:Glucuronosyltransferase n=1 Tax=Sphingomonas ginsenosidimutans TaxID=862134 RepID=A0A2A4I2C2_9SPHN|nr:MULTISPECIES: glycosyltransferase [Sphingomonas]MBY0301339.1 glucuronosyltransferase [Sphingomonas ginsenosidimutans]MEE2916733.1 glycosyltransferase [Pseudomonadota bacterium]PCG10085.1 glucuronosyltransferase [Sphingomonas ginsenosidimutans]